MYLSDGTRCKLIGNHTFVLTDVPPYHDDSGGRVEISVQHSKPPKGKPKETVRRHLMVIFVLSVSALRKQVRSDNDASEVGILGHFGTFWDILGHLETFWDI